jgi:hypothetical protein
LLDESGSENESEGTKGKKKGPTMSGGKKLVKPQKRPTKCCKTTNDSDKPRANKDRTTSSDNSDNSPLSDGKTALKRHRRREEKYGRGPNQKPFNTSVHQRQW